MEQLVANCEAVHKRVSRSQQSPPYFRLNVDRGLEGIQFDDWRRENDIAGHTEVYIDELAEQGKGDLISACVQLLRKEMIGQ